MPIRKEILDQFKEDKKIFVETGLQVGGGVLAAIKAGFEEIYSIELLEDYITECQEKFKDNKNVHLILGDSIVEFPKLIESIKEPSLFWLDSHNPQSATILEEIRALQNHPIKTHTIMIDDLRLLRANYWKVLPGLDELVREVRKINKNYKITYTNSTHYPKDILVAKI